MTLDKTISDSDTPDKNYFNEVSRRAEMAGHLAQEVVYVEGSTIYAQSDDGTQTDKGTSGTDDASVIQSAINNLPSTGGIVFIAGKSTDYTLGSGLTLTTENSRLIGAGGPSKEFNLPSITKLNFTHNDASPAFDIQASGCQIKGLGITADSNVTNQHGIKSDEGTDDSSHGGHLIRDVGVEGFGGHGMLFVEPERVTIERCIVDNTGAKGIYLDGDPDDNFTGKGINVDIRQTRVSDSGTKGIHVDRVLNTTLEHVQVFRPGSGAFIHIDNTLGCDVIAPNIETGTGGTTVDGIVIEDSLCRVIGGFGADADRFISVEGASGTTTRATLIGVRCSATVSEGVVIESEVDSAVIIDHQLNAGTNVTDNSGNSINIRDSRILFGNDTQIERTSANLLQLLDLLEFQRTSGKAIWAAKRSGDSQRRVQVLENGEIQWGDGSNALDTLLRRTAASKLTTGNDDKFAAPGGLIASVDTTGNRPSSPEAGQQHFDTTLSQPIWWDGSNWIDATGTVV